ASPPCSPSSPEPAPSPPPPCSGSGSTRATRAAPPPPRRYFRRTFDLEGAPARATLEITADNGFTAWVNGAEVGKGDSWTQLYSIRVAKQLKKGKNVLAVRATNDGGPAGLVVRLRTQAGGKERVALVSDGAWKAAKWAPAGWQKVDFDDSKWGKVKVLGAYGK